MITEQEWYDKNSCNHAHCPDGCEHPQPVLCEDDELYCGRCLIRFNEKVKMIPCSPDVCND